jgi:hypothetical protein
LLHCGHCASFSPVCERVCSLSCPDAKKALLQPSYSHLNGRSPVCCFRT